MNISNTFLYNNKEYVMSSDAITVFYFSYYIENAIFKRFVQEF